ncbi:methyltransferase domain-containing protein [Endozoicomonas sp. SM1973]|uniref:Methyltransferase domain-containing protein n=1 Tax=Spartinivicinus marinus TaxID=2994442 RepID=A0A853IHL3_9GAMM|nr:class I SAM-dependent methyltransferase [Spartinivicinus marinus]MCX4027072.1 methyltransferase domain-containing protein [Spartinivicinus marinus]NYZ67066.1 methyltransferase domain-containing protein [Spartinivicinus marinus]
MLSQAPGYNKHATKQHEDGKHLLTKLDIRQGNYIIDIGCGTGNVTNSIANAVGGNGLVLAIDPDRDRINIAKTQYLQPQIDWFEGSLDEYEPQVNETFDFAFSNYVFHWIENQTAGIKKVVNLLKPGGRFAFCCVTNHPIFIKDLITPLGKDGEKLISSLYYKNKTAWKELFTKNGLSINEIIAVDGYHFNDVESAMIWWEVTTHGLFAKHKLSSEQMITIKNKYPGEINIFEEEILCMIATKK